LGFTYNLIERQKNELRELEEIEEFRKSHEEQNNLLKESQVFQY